MKYKVVPSEIPVWYDSRMPEFITECISSSYQRKFEINVFCSSTKKCYIHKNERQFLGLCWPPTDIQLPSPSMPLIVLIFVLSYCLNAWTPELPSPGTRVLWPLALQLSTVPLNKANNKNQMWLNVPLNLYENTLYLVACYHFTDEETEIQNDYVICFRSHNL